MDVAVPDGEALVDGDGLAVSLGLGLAVSDGLGLPVSDGDGLGDSGQSSVLVGVGHVGGWKVGNVCVGCG